MEEKEPEFARLVELEGLADHMLGIPFYAAISDGDIDLTKLPPTCYVLTGGGVFLYNSNGITQSLTQHDKGIIGLGEVPPRVTFNVKKMPEKLVASILGFFKWAYQTYHSEAIVLPYYNAKTGEWKILCPEQEVSGGSADADWESLEVPKGFVRVGSWHSHGSMSAYHSSVDTGDEVNDDGFHFVSGNFTSTTGMKPSLVSTLVVNSRRFTIQPSQVLEWDFEEDVKEAKIVGFGTGKSIEPGKKTVRTPIAVNEELPFPEEWKDKVTAKKVSVVVSGGTYPYGMYYGSGLWDDYEGMDTRGNTKVVSTSDIKCWACANSMNQRFIVDCMAAVDILSDPANKTDKDRYLALTNPYVNKRTLQFHTGLADDVVKAEGILKTCGAYNTYLSGKEMVAITRALRWKTYYQALEEIVSKNSLNSTGYGGASFCLVGDSFHNTTSKDGAFSKLDTSLPCKVCSRYCAEFTRTTMSTINQQNEYDEKMKKWQDQRKEFIKESKKKPPAADSREGMVCGDCSHWHHMYMEGLSSPCANHAEVDTAGIPIVFATDEKALDCPDFLLQPGSLVARVAPELLTQLTETQGSESSWNDRSEQRCGNCCEYDEVVSMWVVSSRSIGDSDVYCEKMKKMVEKLSKLDMDNPDAIQAAFDELDEIETDYMPDCEEFVAIDEPGGTIGDIVKID